MGNPEGTVDSIHQSKPENKTSKEGGAEPPPKKPGSKAQGRKRTKTGCLTCRKRRIKCGEERPTCQNCTKSKRQCEGYNQRVVFKDPLSGAYRPSVSTSSHATFVSTNTVVRHGEPFQQVPSGQNQLPLPIAPKPTGSFQASKTSEDTIPMSALPQGTSPDTERRAYSFSNGNAPDPPIGNRTIPPKAPEFFEHNVDTVDRSHIPQPTNRRSPQDQPTHYDFNSLSQPDNKNKTPITPAQTSPLDWSPGQSSGSQQFPQEIFHDSNRQFPAAGPFFQYFPATSSWDPAGTSSVPAPQSLPVQASRDITLQTGNGRTEISHWGFDGTQQHQQGQQLHIVPPQGSYKAEQPTPVSGHRPSMTEDDDYDPFDVSDDVDMEEYNGSGQWHGDGNHDQLTSNVLGMVVAHQAGQDTQSLNLRSFTSFIDRPDMLATYVPSSRSSPLSDPLTARIFCHFVNVTGPSISMFERHPANPSLIFQGQPVPKSQQHIFTYTFPTLAFRNHALLHAILALASLHIAKLQNGPITASLKHYHISLRRIAKSISSPSRRNQVETLAAAMLLAFYECWSADHQKWSNHLLGAKHLVRLIDFAGMTKHIKLVKMQRRREEQARYYQAMQDANGEFLDDRSRFPTYADDIDENIVGILMGKKLRYDQYGQVLDENMPGEGGSKQYTEKDLETYETQRDLWWWYAKQDVYQSILGGGRLYMEYDLWSHCPPRAPLGRLNATYGTFDHLMLLMGRLADFASKDLKRKRLAIKANGGWRPPEMMGMPPQRPPMPGPQGGNRQMPQQPPQTPQMPSFVGMVPGVGKAKLPMGFEEWRENSPKSTNSEDIDLEAQKIEAEEEWQEIRNAFSVLEDHFGEDFQALGPEFSAPIQTPFGTALQYRTYGIAGIWMNFYMGLIACHRCHPAMPPAAMMAAGIAARQTALFANEVGRIAAGLAPDCSKTDQVNPGVGAAIIESTTGLFVAGVQYQDPAQRLWTVSRLRDVARLTGWETAIAVATGCETSWIKTAALGRGPPYTRTTEKRVVTDIWTTSRRIDRAFQAKGVEEEKLIVARTDRVHYALGLLGVEEDFENLYLDGEEKPKPKPKERERERERGRGEEWE